MSNESLKNAIWGAFVADAAAMACIGFTIKNEFAKWLLKHQNSGCQPPVITKGCPATLLMDISLLETYPTTANRCW